LLDYPAKKFEVKMMLKSKDVTLKVNKHLNIYNCSTWSFKINGSGDEYFGTNQYHAIQVHYRATFSGLFGKWFFVPPFSLS